MISTYKFTPIAVYYFYAATAAATSETLATTTEAAATIAVKTSHVSKEKSLQGHIRGKRIKKARFESGC